MTHKVGPKGQVVIPKSMRDELGFSPGTEVDFAVTDSEVRVRPKAARKSLGGSLGGTGMAARLLEDRAKEPK